MAEQTTNLHLKKPAYGDSADVKDFNDNMDILDTVVKQAQDDIDAIEARLPDDNGDQYDVLRSNGDGTSEWVAYGLPTDEQTATAVSDWLDDHPEATTTVQDGAITRAKLDADLKEKTDAVPDLKSAMKLDTGNECIPFNKNGFIEMTASSHSTTVQSSNSIDYICVSCSPGDMFTVSATGGSTALAFGFLNADKYVIFFATSNLTLNETVLVAPTNAAYLVINDVNKNGICIKGISTNKKINDKKYNLIDYSTIKYGYALSNNGTTESQNRTACYTDYIPMDKYVDYYVTAKESTTMRIFYYGATKNFLSTTTMNIGTTKANLKTATASYIRLQFGVQAFTCMPVMLRFADGFDMDRYTLDSSYGSVVKIAASDSSDLDKQDSYIVCDGTNDADIINYIVKQIVAKGGGKIILKKGRYIINSVNYAHHCIEVDVKNTMVEIEGEIVNYNRNQSDGQEANTGAQFYVSDTLYESFNASETNVIMSMYSNSFDGGVVLRNFGIVFPHNQKKIVGLDFLHFNGMCRVEGMYINAYNKDYEEDVSIGTAPDVAVEGCIGLRTICEVSIGAVGTYYQNCTVKGCYEGFAVNSEHVILDKCAAVYCVYGYTFNHYTEAGQHENLLLRCMDERNVNLPMFYGDNPKKQAIMILGLNIERKPGNTPGGEVHDYATEEEPGSWFGELTYTISASTGTTNAVNVPFWEDGHGHGFRSSNLCHLQSADTATRLSYKPNFMETMYDTTLGKQVVCINETNKTWVDMMGNVVD